MKYFVDEEKRKASHSTCYFEFQMGYYHDKCWLPDSISISDTLWDEIVRLSQESGAIWEKVIAEAVPWVNECFKKHGAFTILGI